MKFNFKLIALILFFQVSAGFNGIHAQEITDGSLNTWFLQFSRLNLNEKWSFTNELHYRTGEFLSNPGLILIRPSVDYHLNKEVEFSLGYTLVYAEPFEPYSLQAPAFENNLWWQAWIKNKIGNTSLQHRFREEHRWLDNLVQTENGDFEKDGANFVNRFRYRFTVIFDLIKLNDDALFCVVFDEVWLSQNDQLLFTDLNRNWLYGGLGYRFSKNSNLQLGFNYQSDKVASGEFINSPVIQLSYFHNFHLKSSNSE